MAVPVGTQTNYVAVVRHQLTFVSLGKRKLQLLAFNVKNPLVFSGKHMPPPERNLLQTRLPPLFRGALRRENMVDSKKRGCREFHISACAGISPAHCEYDLLPPIVVTPQNGKLLSYGYTSLQGS